MCAVNISMKVEVVDQEVKSSMVNQAANVYIMDRKDLDLDGLKNDKNDNKNNYKKYEFQARLIAFESWRQ